MLKESIFNNKFVQDQRTIVYNSLHQKFARIPSTQYEDILRSSNDQNDLTKALLADGFLVNPEIDETQIAQLRYLDLITDNTLSMTILASEQCNFRCKYCYESFSKGNISQPVMDGLIRYLKKSISKYKGFSIDWFGGEPLLALNEIQHLSKQVIDICQKSCRPYYSSITTNGYLLTAEVLKKLLKCRITGYQITLDGSQESHDSNRVLTNGEGTFQRIVDNLRDIRDHVHSRLFKIIVRTNLTSSQLDIVEDYLHFWSEEFGGDGRFELYFRPVGDWGGTAVRDIHHDLITSFDDLYTPLLNSSIVFNADAYVYLLKKVSCTAANRNDFVLGSDGQIYKCTMLLDKEFNHIGRLQEDGILIMEEDKLAPWIASNPIPTGKCKSCTHWFLCNNKSCPAKIFSLQGNRSGNCGYERRTTEYILALLDRADSSHIREYN